MKKLLSIILILCLTLALCACGAKAAEETASVEVSESGASSTEIETESKIEFPEKKITLVVPYDAGGVNDVPARLTVEVMNKYLPYGIEVTNIPGSAGTIGGTEVMNSEPDGYTLLVAPPGYALQYALGTCPFTYENFKPICVFAETYQAIVVLADSPYQTLDDFVAAAAKAPGEMKVGAVSGTLPVFSALALETQKNIDVNIVDIEPTAKAAELMGGRIDAYFDSIGNVTQYLQGGQFRCLGIISNERLESLPEVPTFIEMGFEGLDFLRQMFAIWAPIGTPDEVCKIIEDAVKTAIDDPDDAAALIETNNFPCYIDSETYLEMLPEINQAYKSYADSILG